MSSLRSNDFKFSECEDNTESHNRIDNIQANSLEAFIAVLSQLLVSGKTLIGKECKHSLIEMRYQGNFNQFTKTITFKSVNILFSG